jgi:hypothetical protein
MATNFRIFISYRRKGGYDTAKLIYDRLRLDGYSVFFDIDTLENGNFDNELEKKIKKCKDFLLVLSPGVFDRFTETSYDPKDDWVRQEIACALKAEKNIVPLALEGFAYPRRLPNDIKDITRKNSIDLNPRHFEGAYEKMKEAFLVSKPRWKVRYKKKIRYLFAAIFLAFAIYLSWAVFSIYMQAKETSLTADSAVLAKEVEMTRVKDSIRITHETEMALIKDSINTAKDLEIAILKDSIATYKERLKEAREQNKAIKTTTQSKTTKTTTTAKKSK